MKNSIYILVFCALFLAVPQKAQAQGFAALIEKLDLLEKRMNTLEKTQKSDLRNLERKIPTQTVSQDNTVLNEQITQLKADLHNLSNDLNAVQTTAQNTQEPQQDDITVDDLRHLITEMHTTLTPKPQETPEPHAIKAPEGIHISGHGDIYGKIHQGGNYHIGQAEINLNAAVNDRVSVEAAIAYHNEQFEMGAFYAEFKLWGKNAEYFWYSPYIQSANLIVGQFDIPFGIDCRVYPSIDRKLVSAPLAVEQTHGCWNDTGLSFQFETHHINMQTYLVNGWKEEETKLSLGGRLGITPSKHIEAGISFAGFLNHDNQWDELLAGSDLQMNLGILDLKGEYIYQKTALSKTHQESQYGFYGQGLLTLNRLFLVGRYGRITQTRPTRYHLSRLSMGAGWIVQENCELRTEYQKNFQEKDVTYVQAVIGF